jgi:hypothetical protein
MQDLGSQYSVVLTLSVANSVTAKPIHLTKHYLGILNILQYRSTQLLYNTAMEHVKLSQNYKHPYTFLKPGKFFDFVTIPICEFVLELVFIIL